MAETGADARARFVLELEDETSDASDTAAASLSKLRAQLDADTKALAAMQKAMRNVQGASVVNIRQATQLKNAISAKKEAIAAAQTKFLALGGDVAATGKKSSNLRERFAELSKETGRLPGPLAGVTAKLSELLSMASTRGIALLGLAAAITYVVVKTGAAIAELYKYGIAQADARKSEMLRFEGLTKMRFWFQRAAGTADELQSSVDAVSASTALGRGRVAQYAEQLYRMGLRGQNLQSALEGVAIKATTQGDAAAGAFAGWAAGANMAGKSVKRLTDDVKARLGGIAAKQLDTLAVQTEKQKEAFAALFNDLKTDRLQHEITATNNLLTQGTNSGKALKAMLTTLLQPLIDSRAKFEPVIKRFWQGMIIGALHVGIVVLQLRNWFKRTFGASDILKGFDAQKAALLAGKVVVGLLASAVVALGVALLGLATTAAAVAAPFLAVGAAIYSVFRVGRLLVGFLLNIGRQIAPTGDRLMQLWKEIDFKLLGQYMWQGIVSGFNAGKAAVLDAVKGLGADAWGAFKLALGIASPSKVFLRLGAQIPAGAAAGVEAGTPRARRAVASMIDTRASIAPLGVRPRLLAPSPPPPPAPTLFDVGGPTGAPATLAAPVPRAAAAPRAVTLNVGDIHIHASSEKPRDMAEDFRLQLERVLEGLAAQIGALPEPEGAT